MNYREATEFMYNRLPMFQRVGPVAFKKDLKNIRKLCEALGNPQQNFRGIHIAGTNGKGSSAAMLRAILESSGYKTGMYTSPHLQSFTERIQVGYKNIPENEVAAFITDNITVIDQIKPSFFEMTVAMAFAYFSKEEVDVAIIETGLGGRLDSTNIIIPEISLITNISLDHTDMLGKSIKAIAYEKAGIIKKGVPVVIGESNDESDPVFLGKANEYNATIYFADQTYSAFISDDKSVYISSIKDENDTNPLKIKKQFPFYQIKNILGVCQVCKILSTGNYKKIADTDIPEVLNDLFSKPSIRGRWQTLQKNPLIICDVAHNKAGISEIIKEIQNQSYRNLHIVLGMVNDKDVNMVLELLSTEASYYFCQAKIPRAMPASKLKSLAELKGLLGKVIEDVNEAIEAAKAEANEDDLIFVGGSTFVVAEIEGLMIDTGSN